MIDAASSPVTIYRTGTLSLGGGNATIQNNAGISLFGDATSHAQITTGGGTLTARNLTFNGGGSIATTSSGKLVVDDGGSGGSVAYVAGNNGIGATDQRESWSRQCHGGNATFTIADDPNVAAELSISAVVADQAGSNGLIKTGAGNLVLNSANTFSGDVTVNAGTLTDRRILDAGIRSAAGYRVNRAGPWQLGQRDIGL